MSSTLNNDILIQSDLNYDALKDTVSIPSIDLSLFPVPNFNSNPVPIPTTVTNALLTDKNVDGTGCFDNLMTSISKHLTNEFEEGRIEQDKFGDIYSQNMIQAMSIASQFVLNTVTTNYQNQLLKKQLEQQEINNVTAKVQLEITKLNATRARYEALTANTNYAISKQQLANTNADYLLKIKQLSLSDKDIELKELQKITVGKQNLILDVQKIGIEKENLIKIQQESLTQEQVNTQVKQTANLDKDLIIKDKNALLIQEQIDTAILNQTTITKNNLILDKNALLLQEQIDTEVLNQTTITKNHLILDKNALLLQEQIDTAILNQTSITKNNLILDKNLLKIDEEIDLLQSEDLVKTQQIQLVKEQVDTERAKTKNTTSTGSTIVGVLGKEKDLKDAQITLYERQQDAYVVDTKAKVGMMFKDVYAINKSADAGTTVPSSLSDVNINQVVSAMRTAAGI